MKIAWLAVLGGGLGLTGCGGDAFTTAGGDAGEGGVAADSGAGGDSGGSGPTGWCATKGAGALFCDDFDGYPNVGAVTGPWVTQMLGGVFSFDPQGPPSPPNALMVAATVPSASGANTMALRQMPSGGPARPTSRRLEFDFKLGSAIGISPAIVDVFAALAFGGSVQSGAVGMALNNSSLVLVYGAPGDGGTTGYNIQKASALPATGVWGGRYAIEIQYQYQGGGQVSGCAQLYGPTTKLGSCQDLPQSLLTAPNIYAAVGLEESGIGPGGNVSLSFDNVTYTVR